VAAGAPTTFEVHLPTPPSVNALWRRVPGRKKPVISKPYRDWKREAGQWIIAQRRSIQHLGGPFSADVYVPTGTRGDLDNRTKAAFDLLQELGVIANDKHLTKLTVQRGGDVFRVVLSATEEGA
jgi:Holliday junction resolvase RusA-like endonuclease